jgi:uncharacterized membrane protein YccC
MASSSVSFRISRSAEDLAATIHAISQRLVLLEQRLGALELQLTNLDRPDPQEINRLENVDRLLHDCRALLELDAEPAAEHPPTSGDVPPLAEVSELAEEQAFTAELAEDDRDHDLLAA